MGRGDRMSGPLDEGATKLPTSTSPKECMQRWKHSWSWVWHGNEWTSMSRCTTCGEVWDTATQATITKGARGEPLPKDD